MGGVQKTRLTVETSCGKLKDGTWVLDSYRGYRKPDCQWKPPVQHLGT